MKISPKAKLGVTAVVVLSATAAYFGGQTIQEAVDSITTSGLPILLGLVLAAVGVLISTLGNLYNGLMGMAAGFTEAEKRVYVSTVEGFDRSIDHVRDNTLLMLALLAIAMATPLLRPLINTKVVLLIEAQAISLAGLGWGVNFGLTTVTLAVTVLSLWAIYDTLETMFTIHKYYVEVAKHAISTAKPNRQIVFRVADEPDDSAAPHPRATDADD